MDTPTEVVVTRVRPNEMTFGARPHLRRWREGGAGRWDFERKFVLFHQHFLGAAVNLIAVDAVVPMEGWLEPPQPQDLVLTILADNVRGRLDRVWSGGLVKLLEEFGFSVGSSRVALGRLAHRDLISRVKEGRVVYYQLTERTQRLLREGDSQIFTLGHDDRDDETLTVLMHTLPEELRLERGRLGRRLRFLRFGLVQDGTWISAGVREAETLAVLTELDVARYCSVLMGRRSNQQPMQSLLERAWDFPGLNQRYDAFVEGFGKYMDEAPADDRSAFWVRTQLIHNFRQFASLDPGVRSHEFPYSPNRAVAIGIFSRIYSDLQTPAQRYFDEVTSAEKAEVR